PEAPPTAYFTPQYAANSPSNAERFDPFNSFIEEKTEPHCRRSSASMDRYFRVKSSSGIFLSCGLLLGAGIFSCLRSKFFMLDFCARSCLLTTVLAFIKVFLSARKPGW